MKKCIWTLLAAGIIGWHAGPAAAVVKPHGLFQDNIVLQQKVKLPVWGKADPGEEVTVTLGKDKATAKADDKGNWKVHLAPLSAGGPHELVIAAGNTITLKNVMIGEVWVCSGQSNMEWTIDMCGGIDQKKAKDGPSNPNLRLFSVGKSPRETPVDDVGGKWVIAGPETVGPFSAVGYYFGLELQKDLSCPVGIINSSWGGTRAEAWTSRPALRKLAPEYDKEVEAHEAAAKANPQVSSNANAPSVLYNGMIHPILSFPIKGAIWYQGESNVGKAYHYGMLFPAMIQNWREAWLAPKMPFYFVQLAPFLRVGKGPEDSAWAELREAQRLTAKKLPHTGMAVITDIGHEADIHPTPKEPVGQRLAYIALEDTYGTRGQESRKSPEVKDVKFDKGQAVVTFTGPGLISREMVTTDERFDGKKQSLGFGWRVKDGSTRDAEVLGFTIAGADRKFHTAKAKIDGNRVIVSCDQVPEPVAVRYGWANHPVCNLFSTLGVPASPFRSDEFPLTTQPRK